MNQRKSISVIISVLLFVILIADCTTDGKPYAKDTLLKDISGVWKNFQYYEKHGLTTREFSGLRA